MTDIIIQGIYGRMGRALLEKIAVRNDCRIVAGVDREAGKIGEIPVYAGFDALPCKGVIIDFSSPAGAVTAAQYGAEHGLPCVICSTGLSKEDEAVLEAASAKQVIGELKPKADYTDRILSSKGTVPTTAIAKDYGMSAKALNQKLHELRVIYRMGSQWFLYAKYQAKGYTHSKTFDFKHSDGRPDCKMQTEWTQKGRLFLYQLLKKHGVLPMIEREDQEAGH